MRDRLRSIADFIIESYRNDPDLMKVIIVEVTRAANTFGRAHLGEIRQAYDGISGIVARGQEDGTFRSDIPADFATLCFYGAIEQLLTAWIFDALPKSDGEFEQAKQVIVETICDGLAVRSGVSAELSPSYSHRCCTPFVSRARTLMRTFGRLPLRASFRTFPDSRTAPRRRVTVTLRDPLVDSLEI